MKQNRQLTFASGHFPGPLPVFAARVPGFALQQVSRFAVVLDGAVDVQVVPDNVAASRHLGLLARDHCVKKMN